MANDKDANGIAHYSKKNIRVNLRMKDEPHLASAPAFDSLVELFEWDCQ